MKYLVQKEYISKITFSRHHTHTHTHTHTHICSFI